MDMVQAAAFAMLWGLTACGAVATLLELAHGGIVRFRAPYVSRGQPFVSAARVVGAGPFMLGNEALTAWREGRLSLPALLSCGATALAWCLACGTFILGSLIQLATGG